MPFSSGRLSKLLLSSGSPGPRTSPGGEANLPHVQFETGNPEECRRRHRAGSSRRLRLEPVEWRESANRTSHRTIPVLAARY